MPPPPTQKTDQQAVRRHNLGLVLGLLAREGPASRAALAERAQLTKATVSTLVARLEQHGLVADQGPPTPGRRGRPGRLVAVAPEPVAVGLAIDLDHVGVCVTDLTGRVVLRRRADHHNEGTRPHVAVGRLVRLAGDVLGELRREGHTWRDATVAVPGLVDPRTGTVVAAPNLGWTDADVGGPLTEALGIPVRVDNEADLVATAELALGWGRAHRDLLVLSTGVGVGAGVVVDGAVFRGAHGFGGELGHFVIDPLGPRCACGNRGCLERYVGRRSLPGALRARDDSVWAIAAAEAASRGASRVLTALDEVATRLGRALVSAVHLFDPEVIVLAGDLAPVTPWIAGPLTRDLEEHVLGARWATYQVVASGLGPAAASWGGAVAGRDRILADPLGALDGPVVAQASRPPSTGTTDPVT